MNEQTQQALNDFVTQAIGAAKAGAAWTAEQSPLLVQEWLRWYLADHAISAGIFLAVLVPLALVCRSWWRKADWEYGPDEYAAGIIVCSIGVCVCAVGAVVNGMGVAKVLVAPRVVVIEGLASWLR